MHILNITWDMSQGLDLGFMTLRYYSLLFAAGFVLGYQLMKRIFKREGVPLSKLDTLLTYVVIATVVGARLGHVFFYDWDFYRQQPLEILKVWKGGLASHGAAVAIIIAIVIYCKRELGKSTLWMLDRLVITIALAATLIRLGNWFNSEIYGEVANSSMQTVFVHPPQQRLMENFEFIHSIAIEEQNEERVTDSLFLPVYHLLLGINPQVPEDKAELLIRTRIAGYLNNLSREERHLVFEKNFNLAPVRGQDGLWRAEVLGLPRHPTQLYESLAYLLIFFILFRLYQVSSLRQRQGFLFGAFLVLVFGFRFFIENIKEVQIVSEYGRRLNQGQLLSIPLVAAGLFFMLWSKSKTDPPSNQSAS